MQKKASRTEYREAPCGRFWGALPTAAAILCACALFSSCRSSLKIEVRADAASFSYSAQAGAAFLETISAISGNSASAADGAAPLFDAKEIQALFQEAGFVNVAVDARSDGGAAAAFRHGALEKSGIDISGWFPENQRNALEEAGLLRRKSRNPPSEAPDATLSVTAETLRGLYSALPGKLQSYLDLFMAPTFSGEAMSDEEYLDLIATVYGSALADEISAAEISLSLVSPRGRQVVTVPLLRLLNFTEPVELSV
ncbi:MAG: hypothetical protein K2H09_01480 [Treponemataceae bacterium]|nr:hypothetical protein [Treponemataceae bacterium]